MAALRRLLAAGVICATVCLGAGPQSVTLALAQSAKPPVRPRRKFRSICCAGLPTSFRAAWTRSPTSLIGRAIARGSIAPMAGKRWRGVLPNNMGGGQKDHRGRHRPFARRRCDVPDCQRSQREEYSDRADRDVRCDKSPAVPKNVLHFVNFYQNNGFGKKVSPAPDFKGELSNVDLTADSSLSHTTIEKSPRLHALVMQKIADIVDRIWRPGCKRPSQNSRRPKRAHKRRLLELNCPKAERREESMGTMKGTIIGLVAAGVVALAAMPASAATLKVKVDAIKDSGTIPNKYAFCAPAAQGHTTGGPNHQSQHLVVERTEGHQVLRHHSLRHRLAGGAAREDEQGRHGDDG